MAVNGEFMQCYNKGCSKKFKQSDNNSGACTFHPGEPYFHDAYKEWTCCKKRSVDFTEFLSIKGCKTSFHNHVKPPEKEKPKTENPEEVISVAPPKPREAMPRPDVNEPVKPIKVTVTPSLKNALADQLGKMKLIGQGDDAGKNEVKVGDPCQNRGCGKKYEGPASAHQQCVYHSGLPIFHEGMKYWSCCEKKTTEFDQFLKQEGCSRGDHVWKKTEEDLKKVPTCRTDWYQTGSEVYATFFAKNSVPEKSLIEINPVKLKVKLVFDAGQSLFEKELVLGGIVDVDQSEVTMAGPKVEVRMKKAELVAWKSLEYSR